MKTLIQLYRRLRYRRLYARLFRIYARLSDDADYAGEQAAIAFQWHTGLEWRKLFNTTDD